VEGYNRGIKSNYEGFFSLESKYIMIEKFTINELEKKNDIEIPISDVTNLEGTIDGQNKQIRTYLSNGGEVVFDFLTKELVLISKDRSYPSNFSTFSIRNKEEVIRAMREVQPAMFEKAEKLVEQEVLNIKKEIELVKIPNVPVSLMPTFYAGEDSPKVKLDLSMITPGSKIFKFDSRLSSVEKERSIHDWHFGNGLLQVVMQTDQGVLVDVLVPHPLNFVPHT
jgi:hypothetical protein